MFACLVVKSLRSLRSLRLNNHVQVRASFWGLSRLAFSRRSRCGEMADAQDLKSWDRKKSCEFESHHRHQSSLEAQRKRRLPRRSLAKVGRLSHTRHKRFKLRPGKPAKFHPLRSKDEGCRVVAHRREDGLIRRHERGLRLGKPVLTRTRRKRRLPRRSTAKASFPNDITVPSYDPASQPFTQLRSKDEGGRIAASAKAAFPTTLPLQAIVGRPAFAQLGTEGDRIARLTAVCLLSALPPWHWLC